MNQTDLNSEKRKLFHSIWFPVIFIAVLWAIKTFEITTYRSFVEFGLYPLSVKGLVGIVTAPFIHSGWEHLLNNTPSLFVLLWGIFYFYKEIAWRVFFLTWFMNGFWLWFFGRESYHIGASGLIYGFGAFLFISGIIRKNRNLLTISMLVAFLYGSMIWGIFPIKERVSWESHFTGLIAGIVLSFYYKKYGPPQDIFFKNKHLDDEDDEDLFEDEEMLEYFKKFPSEDDDKT